MRHVGGAGRSADQSPDHQLDRLQGQLQSRLLDSAQVRVLGVSAAPNPVLLGGGPLQHHTHTRRLRIRPDCSTPTVHELVGGPSCSRPGRPDSGVGSCHLLIPPSPHAPQSPREGSAGGDRSHPHLPPLASSSVVAGGSQADGDGAPVSAPQQGSHPDDGGGASLGVPGPTPSTSNFRAQYSLRYSGEEGLDQSDFDFLSQHLSNGTSSGYGYVWAKFSTFCKDRNIDPFTASQATIVKYLRKLFDDGARYRTVNYVCSTISKLHTGFGGVPAGQLPLVRQAVKSVFR